MNCAKARHNALSWKASLGATEHRLEACYINAVTSSLQVHGEASEMALEDRSTVRKANVAWASSLCSFPTLSDVTQLKRSTAQRCERNTGWKPMLCYINAVASSLQVHGEAPKMALTEPQLHHSITPPPSPNLSRFHTLNEIFGLAAGLVVGELAWRSFHEITGSACQSSAYSAIQG